MSGNHNQSLVSVVRCLSRMPMARKTPSCCRQKLGPGLDCRSASGPHADSHRGGKGVGRRQEQQITLRIQIRVQADVPQQSQSFLSNLVARFSNRRANVKVLGRESDYEFGVEEFESLRARHLSHSYIVDFQSGQKWPQTKISI